MRTPKFFPRLVFVTTASSITVSASYLVVIMPLGGPIWLSVGVGGGVLEKIYDNPECK